MIGSIVCIQTHEGFSRFYFVLKMIKLVEISGTV